MVLRKQSGKDAEDARLRRIRYNSVNARETRAARRDLIKSMAGAAIVAVGVGAETWISSLWHFGARMLKLFGLPP